MPNLYLFVFLSVFQWMYLIPLGLIVMNAMTQAMTCPRVMNAMTQARNRLLADPALKLSKPELQSYVDKLPL